jgi:ferredoxin-type protein NapH
MSAPVVSSRSFGVARAAVVVAPGRDAVRAKGWWRANRFLVLRRLSQLSVFLLFALGPLAGVWIVKGNLSASVTLGVLPLTDPFVIAQVLVTRHLPETSALLGAALVLVFYALAGGRMFCACVCPVNLVTDSAAWLRRRLRITSGRAPRGALRYWLLAAGGAAAVFAFDLLVAPRGWCGHVCPVGAAYALIGSKSLLRVSARHSSRCNDCTDCYAVCPEPQVIVLPLKGKQGAGPVISDRECTNCGRCIDVCAPDVFAFTHRFDPRRD